jgi:hypothetical protein
VRRAPGGLAQPNPAGFQAQAELSRRLMVELRETKEQLARSGNMMAWLTGALVVLTALLLVLTLILLFQGD